MFEHKDNLIQLMRSPLNIAAAALTELEDRIGGNRIVADPNNPACHLLEFGSSISSAAIQAMEAKFPLIYPHRAMTMEDLYQHMSDYDYLAMYSSPSSCEIKLAMPKRYLIDYALNYNTNYKKVTIPASTVFMVGRYPFGMYYPIDILINNYTNSFTTVYDTSTPNPLKTLRSNVVHKDEFTYRAVDFIVLDFYIYQFAKSTIEETLVSATGFAKKLVYNNDFYAIRLYNYKDGVYTELNQSQSKMVYDTTVPTALVRVLPDEQKVLVTIPQIYFEQGMMGGKLVIDIYTTLGALDIDTSNISSSAIQANFGLKSRLASPYAELLKSAPFDMSMQVVSSKITGGSNAISVDKLRDRVVNDLLYKRVPISEADLAVYLDDQGFYLKKYLDNVTDRIYYAYRVLENGQGSIIPSLTLPMRMKNSYADNYAAFRKQSDNSITVLPTALYKYVEETDDVVPLTNEELQYLATANKLEVLTLLNNNQYLKSPFHLRFDLSQRWPECKSYNLMNPSITKVIFETENYNITPKMMSYGAEVVHLDSGVGGYEVALDVYKSDDLLEVDEEDILVYIVIKTTDKYLVGRQATYVETRNNRYIYRFNVDTNYHISSNDELYITNFQNSNFVLSEHSIQLESDFHIVYLVRRTAIEGDYEEAPQAVTLGVPDTYLDEFVGLTRQYITIHLGHNLDDVIKNDVEVSSGTKVYNTWDHDVPLTYTSDEYARGDDGNLLVETGVDGIDRLIRLHQQGEIVQDEYGQNVLLHKQGDVRFNDDGSVSMVSDRETIFYTNVMLLDAKVFVSERSADLNFVANLPTILEGYFDKIRELSDQLLERTHLYFRCVRSTGSAMFNLGDGIIVKQSLEMSFRINCYVPSYVKKSDEIQAEIHARTCEAINAAIQTKTISMLDIFKSVQTKLSDYIDHFSLLGINDDVSNQTFIIVNEDAQPSIRRQLVLTEDNVLTMEDAVDITFIALNDNSLGVESVDV